MNDLRLLLGLVGGLLSQLSACSLVTTLDDVCACSWQEDVVNGLASSIASCQIPSGAGGWALERRSICLAIDAPLTMISEAGGDTNSLKAPVVHYILVTSFYLPCY